MSKKENYYFLSSVILILDVGFKLYLQIIELNRLSSEQVPYDLNIYSWIDINGESDILEHLYNNNLDLEKYAEAMEEISIYNADLTYGDILANQELELWRTDTDLPSKPIQVVSISDFNKAMALQGKEPYTLGEDEFYLNCNYNGTIMYMEQFYNNANSITIAGNTLKPANDSTLSETFFMTSIGNNDRGSLVVPDKVVSALQKYWNIVLVQYKPTINPPWQLASSLAGNDAAHTLQTTLWSSAMR